MAAPALQPKPPVHHSGRHRLRVSRELDVGSIGIDVPSLTRPVDWAQLFGASQPVEIEIGLGRGTFLTEQAQGRPGVSFLGIEWSRAFWEYTCDRLRRRGCWNARCVHAEALSLLKEFVPADSVAAVHLYFPDPWPKKRHHKRRLVQPPFVSEVERILAPGGRLQVVTDHFPYFEQIERVLSGSSLRGVPFEPVATPADGELVGSNFERKYRRQGKPFHAAAAIKIR